MIDSNNITLDKLNKKMELIQQAETNNNEKEFGKLSLEYEGLAEELVSKARDLAIYTGEEKSIQVMWRCLLTQMMLKLKALTVKVAELKQ